MRKLVLVLALFGSLQVAEVAKAQSIVNYSFEEPVPGDATKAKDWKVEGAGYSRRYWPSGAWDQNYVLEVIKPSSDGVQSGTSYEVKYTTPVTGPISVFGKVWGYNIVNLATDKYGAYLYVRFEYNDGTFGYCSATVKTKNVGTFGWRHIGCNSFDAPNPLKPVVKVQVKTLLAVKGKALFDDIHVDRQQPNGARVAIRIDDGTIDLLTKVYPSIKSRGWCASIALVPTYLTSGDPAYINVPQAKQMIQDCFELISHGWSHQDMTTLGSVNLENEYYASKQFFIQNGFPTPTIFALPRGGYNQFVIGMNFEKGYYDYLTNSDTDYVPRGAHRFSIKVHKIESTTPLTQINSILAGAYERQETVIFLVHRVLPSCPDQFCATEERWEQILTAIQGSGLPVMTLGQALNFVNSPN